MSEEKVLDFIFDNKEIQVPGVYVEKNEKQVLTDLERREKIL